MEKAYPKKGPTYYIGCSGWRNVWWKDNFYPSELDSKDYLSYYAKTFGFVEVNLGNNIITSGSNSSHSNTLRKGLVDIARPIATSTNADHGNNNTGALIYQIAKKWSRQTPEDFRFSIRIPRPILFDNNNCNANLTAVDNNVMAAANRMRLGQFLEDLAPIEEKVLAVIIDTTPSLTLANGREWLESILDICTYHGYSAALQFHNSSWFQDLTYNILKKHGASIVWSCDIGHYNHYPYTNIVISDFVYLRLNNYNRRNNNNDTLNSCDNETAIYNNNYLEWLKKANEKIVKEENINYVIIVADSPILANSIYQLLDLPKKISPSLSSSSPSPHHKKVSSNEADKQIVDKLSSSLATSFSSSLPAVNIGWADDRKIIVCVDLNAFYPSCEELRNPSLRGKPHAVIMTDEEAGKITKGVVSSCSYEARRYGIKSAMSLSKAKSLCPDLILLPVDIRYYSQISKHVMAVLEEFANVVEQASIDEAYLDCTSKIQKEGYGINIEELGNKIKQAIKEKCNGLSCSIGIAPTKSAAKIACDYKKPNGLTVITPPNLKNFLSSLEVSKVAGIGPKTEQALNDMGIRTLGQLAESNVSRLIERFGKNGLWMWKVSNGIDEEPVQPRGEHVSLSTEYTLDYPTRDKGKIQQFLYELVDELYERASRYGYQFRTVGVKLVRANNFAVETRETTFANNQNSRSAILSSIEPLLNKFSLSTDKPAIRKVGLKISHLFRQDITTTSTNNIAEANKGRVVQKSLLDYINNG